MPSSYDELDTPTTVVGEEEYFPSSSNKELIETINQLQVELEAKREKLKLKDRELKEKKNQLRTERTRNILVQGVSDYHQEKWSGEQEKVKNYQWLYENKQAELVRDRDNFFSQIVGLKKKIWDLEQSHEETQEELNQTIEVLKAEKARLKGQIKANFWNQKKNQASLIKTNDLITRYKDWVKNDSKTIQNKIRLLQEKEWELGRLRVQINSLTSENGNLANELSRSTDRITNLEQEKADNEEEIAKLKEKLEEANQDVANYREAQIRWWTIKFPEEATKLNNTKGEDKWEISHLIELVLQNKDQTLTNARKKIKWLRGQSKDFKIQLQKDNQIYSGYLKGKQTDIEELEEAGGTLVNAYYNKEQELETNQLDLKELLERFNHSEETLESKNKLIIALAHRLNVAENQRDNYLAELNDLDNDFRDQEKVSIDKNTKLAQTIAKNKDLNKENNSLKVQLTYYQDQDGRMRNTIVLNQQEKTDLEQAGERLLTAYWNKDQEVNDLQTELNQIKQERDNCLNQITDLKKNFHRTSSKWKKKYKTACQQTKQLETQLTNHTCPSCPLIHLPEPHVCPIEVNCSHSDYDNLKSNLETTQKERDTALKDKENYQSQLNDQEQRIVQQLNNTFNLGLDKEEKDLAPVINKLKELINKPPLTFTDETIQQELEQAQQTILKLEKQLKATSFGEDLEVIKQLELNSLEKELNISLSSEFKEQIQQATSYQQLSSLRNAEIKKHLSQSLNNLAVVQPTKAIIKSPSKEKVILISLLVVSLVSVSGLLMRLRNKSRK